MGTAVHPTHDEYRVEDPVCLGDLDRPFEEEVGDVADGLAAIFFSSGDGDELVEQTGVERVVQNGREARQMVDSGGRMDWRVRVLRGVLMIVMVWPPVCSRSLARAKKGMRWLSPRKGERTECTIGKRMRKVQKSLLSQYLKLELASIYIAQVGNEEKIGTGTVKSSKRACVLSI